MLSYVLLCHLLVCCNNYGVSPEFALAVATIESTKDGKIVVGPIGKRARYIGPMAIERSYAKPPYNWDIYNPYENIRIGVKALRGDPKKVLRRYNSKYSNSYGKAIMAMTRQYKRQRIFDNVRSK